MKIDRKGALDVVPKRDLEKVPSPGPGQERCCCYLLHFNKVRGLRKGSLLGTMLESILETLS